MLTIVATAVLALVASFQSPPPAPPPDQEYYDGFMTTMGEISLRRETTMVALASLDRQVAAIVADQVFREYARSMETAKARAVAALFTEEAGQRRRATLPAGELVRVANELERSVIDATTKAIDELAAAGGHDEATVAAIRADVFRRLYSVRARYNFLMRVEDEGEPADCLLLWQGEAMREPLLAPHAAKAFESSAVSDALACFRAEGERLGRAAYEQVAEHAAFYNLGDPELAPPALRIDRKASKRADADWRAANGAMAQAFEKALVDMGEPLAAAAWSVAYLTATEHRTLPSELIPQRVVAMASLHGIPRAEAELMRVALRDALPQQASLLKKVIAEYVRWEKAIAAAESSWAKVPPPDELVAAFDALEANGEANRKRIVATVSSPIVRETLAGVTSSPIELPFWRQIQSGRAIAPDIAWSKKPPAQEGHDGEAERNDQEGGGR
jgi:hypothetical protein